MLRMKETGKGGGGVIKQVTIVGQFSPARELQEPGWSMRLGVIRCVTPPDLLWVAEQVPGASESPQAERHRGGSWKSWLVCSEA